MSQTDYNHTYDDLIGAPLTTIKEINVYSYASNNGTGGLIKSIKRNTYLGTISSWISKEGNIWLEIKVVTPSNFGNRNYVYIKSDWNSLHVNQDDLYTPNSEIKDPPTLTESITNTVVKVATIGVVGYGIVQILKSLIIKK